MLQNTLKFNKICMHDKANLGTVPLAVDVGNDAVQRLKRDQGLGSVEHARHVVLKVTLLQIKISFTIQISLWCI